MDKKLLAALAVGALVGLLIGKGLGSGKPSFADGRADGCNKALDSLTGGAVSAGVVNCENRKGQLYVVGQLVRGGEANLDAQ